MMRSSLCGHALARFVRRSLSTSTKPIVHWLDLRGSGLSSVERLLLEECLLRHDIRNWMMVGHHEPTQHRYLRLKSAPRPVVATIEEDTRNDAAIVVLGIGGKPERLLNIEEVKQDSVLTIKRFSGGGTVVLDYDSIWTTIVMRPSSVAVDAFPRPIMEWTADQVFGPLFDRLHHQNTRQAGAVTQSTLVMDTKSCAVENTGRTIQLPSKSTAPSISSSFHLRENDYVLGERKMGGNAQSITGKGWLHHTSWLWDFDPANMAYLTLPDKRPDYRGDRDHDDFLVRLNKAFPKLIKSDFYTALKGVCDEAFDLQVANVRQALQVVDAQGGLQQWLDSKSRIKILKDL